MRDGYFYQCSLFVRLVDLLTPLVATSGLVVELQATFAYGFTGFMMVQILVATFPICVMNWGKIGGKCY